MALRGLRPRRSWINTRSEAEAAPRKEHGRALPIDADQSVALVGFLSAAGLVSARGDRAIRSSKYMTEGDADLIPLVAAFPCSLASPAPWMRRSASMWPFSRSPRPRTSLPSSSVARSSPTGLRRRPTTASRKHDVERRLEKVGPTKPQASRPPITPTARTAVGDRRPGRGGFHPCVRKEAGPGIDHSGIAGIGSPVMSGWASPRVRQATLDLFVVQG